MNNKEMQKEKEFYIMQYKRAYKELQNECNNLKKAIECTDPLLIDFDSQIKTINHIKDVLDQLHYKIMSREFNIKTPCHHLTTCRNLTTSPPAGISPPHHLQESYKTCVS